MQDENISPSDSGDDWETNEQADAKWQARVLLLLLSEYPHQLSEVELTRELVGERPAFAERDAVERAVEDLVRVGLLSRCESLILLTRAARHFDSLNFDE
jgi:hypothetical protein